MTLSVDISHRLGSFSVEAAFESAGRLTALFGKSGAGKTTIVNVIAGLMRPDRARISVDGVVFVDTVHRTFVRKHKRRVGYIFQEGRLFPHLTIRQNLLYGRWFAGELGEAVKLEEVVALLGIGHLMRRRPHDLSGGEKQRVAIGRALLAEPRLLLMDEPLASLDDERKAEILPYIERLRDEVGVPIVYVSHAVSEIARLATTVVVISDGRVGEVGPVSEILSSPLALGADSREAGGILTVRVIAHDTQDDLTVLAAKSGQIAVPRVAAEIGAELRVHIHARDVILATEEPRGLSALNVLPARVVRIGGAAGPIVDVVLDFGGDRLLSRITRRSLTRLAIKPGHSVFAVLKSIAIERRDIGFAFGDGRDDSPSDA